MRKNRGKVFIIVASVLLSLYFLYPTYKDYHLHSQLATLHGPDSIQFVESKESEVREARAKRIKLGLDLQGGMRVVLEVNVLKLVEDLAKNKDGTFAEVLKQVREDAKKSEESPVLLLRRRFEERQVRLSRYYGSLRDENDKIYSFLEDEAKKAIDRGIEIVRNRVDQYGVSEPSIQKLGGTRIIVELPGVTKESEVRQLLQGTALLEFKLLKDPEVVYNVLESVDKALASIGGVADSSDTTRRDTTRITTPEGEKTPEQIAKEHPLFSLIGINRKAGEAAVPEEYREKVRRILEREDVRALIPKDMQFAWSAKTYPTQDGRKYYNLFALKATPDLTGGVVVNARATIDPNSSRPIVTMEMNNEGSRDWARITGANIDKRIAIVLDNAVFSAPVVRNKIIGGHSQIEGMDNTEEARLLEIVLKAGALPAPVEIVEQRSVGASLGEDSIRSGLTSSAVAIVITIFFMFFYYRTGGAVANVAMVFCMLFLVALLAAFQATLTLPGIAGIILTLAMSVDANVLIYERIREELATGKTLRAAIDAGYEKAFTAIFDSNLTALITGLILYQFGTGPVQGFALTLMIGILVSMFSAIFITRVMFEVIADKYASKINFG